MNGSIFLYHATPAAHMHHNQLWFTKWYISLLMTNDSALSNTFLWRVWYKYAYACTFTIFASSGVSDLLSWVRSVSRSRPHAASLEPSVPEEAYSYNLDSMDFCLFATSCFISRRSFACFSYSCILSLYTEPAFSFNVIYSSLSWRLLRSLFSNANIGLLCTSSTTDTDHHSPNGGV